MAALAVLDAACAPLTSVLAAKPAEAAPVQSFEGLLKLTTPVPQPVVAAVPVAIPAAPSATATPLLPPNTTELPSALPAESATPPMAAITPPQTPQASAAPALTPATLRNASAAKPVAKLPTTIATLRLPETPPVAEVANAAIATAQALPPTTANAPTAAEASSAPATPTDPVATPLPAASPEQFLQWLDSLKTVSDRLPVRSTAADTPNTLTARLSSTVGEGAAIPLLEARAATVPDTSNAATTTAGLPFVLPPASPLLTAPAAVSPVLPSAPLALDSPDWPQQLGEQIQWRLGVGIQQARIEISPRELGAVDVRLSMDDKGLSVHLSAAHATTRELLQAELPRLRETLQQGGVLVADAQVGREAPGQQSPGRDTPRGWPQAKGQGDERSDASSGALLLRPVLLRRGLLDDYA